MESYNTIFFQKLRACNEWKQERSKIVWTDFVAVYPILNSIHRCVKNNILNLLLIFILVSDLFVSLKHTQKIIKNNAMFVMVEDDLYSSQPTNLMLQTNSKCTRNMEKELQIIFERKNIFSLLLWLNEVKINIPNACKILTFKMRKTCPPESFWRNHTASTLLLTSDTMLCYWFVGIRGGTH